MLGPIANKNLNPSKVQSNQESSYRVFANTFRRLGVNGTYFNISKETCNIFQPPQAHTHESVFAKTGSGKSILVARKLFEAQAQAAARLKVNFKPTPSQ